MQERCKKGKKPQKTKKLACKLVGSFDNQSSTEDPAPVLQTHNKLIGIQLPPASSVQNLLF